MQKPATLTALTKEMRPPDGVGATHGPGLTQYRKPKRLLNPDVSFLKERILYRF